MTNFPKKMLKFFPNFLHILLIPAFFLLCVLLYEPAPLCELLRTGEGDIAMPNVFSFNTSIVSAIILLVITGTRLPIYFFGRKMGVSMQWYIAWCIGEVVLMAAFMALYLALLSPVSGDYFIFLGECVSTLASLMVYPYLILLLTYAWQEALHKEELPDEGVRLKFYDSRHLLKFAATSSSILYMEADENYIIIHYMDNGAEKKYQLRNSMKNLESLCEKAGFVRTHKGFIVNPSHIKSVRKDAGGQYLAELGEGSDSGIPVSKKYYERLMNLL